MMWSASGGIPPGIRSVEFEKGFGYPGKFKTWEYLLMAGPYGKYLLEDCFHPDVQVVVFQYLDLIGLMWQKTISSQQLNHLEHRMPIVLTLMERCLPAWELDLNRHKMIHLVRAIRQNGPCWAWAMFGPERFWKHLTDWMTQKSHPEATIFNAHYSFKTACVALPELVDDLLADDADEVWEGHSAQSYSTVFTRKMPTFDGSTNQLILPTFLQAHQGVSIEMSDSSGFQSFGSLQFPDKHHWQAELHLFYMQFPELCQACTCCKQYNELWDRFMQAEVSGTATKQRLPGLLQEWHRWAKQQPDLCQQAKMLCLGPRRTVEVFDRATIQGVPFSTTKTEGKKMSRESVVLMKDNKKFWAGRVLVFLSHTPPGVGIAADSDAYIAHVHWYNHVPEREAMSAALGCPVFKTSFMDDSGGNLWPVEKLAPCRLGAVYHKTRKDRLVILSRFATFLESVPSDPPQGTQESSSDSQ